MTFFPDILGQNFSWVLFAWAFTCIYEVVFQKFEYLSSWEWKKTNKQEKNHEISLLILLYQYLHVNKYNIYLNVRHAIVQLKFYSFDCLFIYVFIYWFKRLLSRYVRKEFLLSLPLSTKTFFTEI